MAATLFAVSVTWAAAPPVNCLAMSLAAPQAQEPAQSGAGRRIGVIKAISGSSITMAQDSGAEVNVTAQDATRILRIAPGDKNLKNAVAVTLQDLQVGDRILVAGKISEDTKGITAASIVVMKLSDVAARREREIQDWQKRGTGGIVSAVDPAAGVVTISVAGFSGKKPVAIKTSQTTVLRRYAPDSNKIEDAKPSSLQDIKTGDQLRARGDRNADGTEVTAEEILTGVFPDITATIISVDASSGTIVLQDLQTRKQLQVRVTSDSQMHKLPAEMAQRFAMRLKGAAAGSGAGQTGAPSTSAVNGQSAPEGAAAAGRRSGGNGMVGGAHSGGASDFQQMINRSPAVAVADLHNGDAVRILATEGTSSTPSTVITLVGGIEPILEAAPKGSEAMALAPWTLGGPAGGDAASQ